MRLRSIPCLIVSLFVLSGCALQPNEIDLKSSIEDSLQKDLGKVLHTSFLGVSPRDLVGIDGVRIASLRVVECTRQGLKRFRCQIFMDYEVVFRENSVGSLFEGAGSQRGLYLLDCMKEPDGWLVLAIDRFSSSLR